MRQSMMMERKIEAGPRWYVLRVAPQSEAAVKRGLALRGIEVETPTYTVWRWKNHIHRKQKRKKIARKFPLLPGYVLALLPNDVNWFAINETPHVLGAVGWGGKYRPADTVQVERLLAEAHEAAEREAWQETGVEFEVGQQVEISGGPFAGFSGPVISQAERRARVMVMIFGRETVADVETFALVKA